MEQVLWLNLAFLFFFLFLLKFILKKPGNPKNLPPGPPAIPIIGHLHLLNPLPSALHELSEKYGHVLFLRFGMKKVLMISSPAAVEECFTRNDIIFANRPQALAGNDALDKEAKQLQEMMREFIELLTVSNLNDFLPFLQWVDVQGMEKRMKTLMKEFDKFLQLLVHEHRQMRSDSTESSDTSGAQMTLIDLMLSLHETEPELYTDETIKGVILAMLVAGTESSSTAMEWAMSLLLNHPEAMAMASAEIQINVGLDHFCRDSDLSKLNYLQNVINETFRIYPPLPLLVPHFESSDDCTVCGFDVPRGTMLLVNTWSIHRDPKLWKDPTRFMPERFRVEEGEGYNLLPFGAGRRICPGAVLGRRVVGLLLAALIQSFEWERVSTEKINTEEGSGFTMPRAEPLEALCKPRQAMMNLLTTLSTVL